MIEKFLEETKKGLVKGEEVRLLGYYSFKAAMTSRIAWTCKLRKKWRCLVKEFPSASLVIV